MPKIIGSANRVVEVDGLAIDEYVGNVGSKTDDISIAVVNISSPTSEPWLTLDYDEWMVVLEERLEIHHAGGVLTVKEGETVFIAKGERFRPVFPVAGAKYIPVCIPAFRPDRCHREEEGGVNTSDVATNLVKLHSEAAAPSANEDEANPTSSKTVYHMCQKELWDAAVTSGKAYFPPTFVEDGFFTHATAVPARLMETANHFYTGTKGDWICLELSTEKMEQFGLLTVFEQPKPVGVQSVSEAWEPSDWKCPHIYGGIPVTIDGIVSKIYDMKRDSEGNFLAVVGLTDTTN